MAKSEKQTLVASGRKDAIIRLRVSAEDKEILRQEASKMGSSLSSYILECALEDAREANKAPLGSHHEIISPAPHFPGKMTKVKLSDGTVIGSKKTFSPDPK